MTNYPECLKLRFCLLADHNRTRSVGLTDLSRTGAGHCRICLHELLARISSSWTDRVRSCRAPLFQLTIGLQKFFHSSVATLDQHDLRYLLTNSVLHLENEKLSLMRCSRAWNE
ncbi:uncharacterized protein LOC112348190 [Selaginella moellendorffii]|uniref:uncharacterized protein LOC112348190 n=1 Tax=Selaginella moellendorffii TaxID=88036 RepID=UPI000D1C4513|nr:uncharacterized protein LOC112348190 [Selaginella moellendorffii]|eukprot:XP_024536086.1 uncharacterized protein LOC112348190 [Selaginella moellendorffii]